MAQVDIEGMRVAVLATAGVERVEVTEPGRALRAPGAEVVVVGLARGEIQGMNHDEKGDRMQVDEALADVSADAFAALLLPGGVANPDRLRTESKAVDFVRHFVTAGKPIAAIRHGPWTLIEADGVRGRKMTSRPSLQTELRNAGAVWEDRAVVRDGTLVTSRKPDDLPAFCEEMLGMLGHARDDARPRHEALRRAG